MKKLIFYFTILLTSLSLFSEPLFAQVTSSSVSGKVKDGSGGAIPGATVVLLHVPTGTKYSVVTTQDGAFKMVNINPGGPYKLTVSFIGFDPDQKENISLGLGTDQHFDVVLKDGTKQLKEVKVVATKGGGRSATRFGEGKIKEMPSLNRSLQDITRATPQSSNNSFLGTNYRYNNVTLDGAINNDAIGFSPSMGGQGNTSGQPGSSTRTNPVSLDAIQDIQVYLAPYDVKIGNFLGGSINAVTRSGTNDVTGSVYGYGRNASLVGPNNAGDKSKEPGGFHDYQTGFRVGFPILKDKLFFFTNMEITRRQDPIILAAGSPDIANVIDKPMADRISKVMQNYGLDAGTDGNYNIYSKSNKFFNRLDWNINAKNQLSIRNNTITSRATNLERDQQNFRFGSIDFEQVNNQNSTVAELKSRFSNTVSNSLIIGYSSIHDYRNPLSNPALPQIQIAGKTPGTTIFLGTDREGSIFDMKQKTFEFTDNLTFYKGKHTITVGTHNELYNIQYGFVNSWNGRVDYGGVTQFENNDPSRVRANYNYTNNSRDYIMANPPATFRVNMFSLYGQDDIQITDNFRLTPGLRFDLADIPKMQELSAKTTNAPVDPNYGTSYTYTQPKDIKNSYLGKIQVSPRLGFNYDVYGDKSFIVRGGTGLFTGRIPFAWLGYAYYNNGNSYGAYDNKSSNIPFTPGSNPITDGLTGNGQAGFVQKQLDKKGGNPINVNDASGATQVDLIDNNFKMPQAWRSSLAFEYTTPDQFKFSLEGIYTKVIKDLKFQHINLIDNPIYYPYDVNHEQPIYQKNANGSQAINSKYTNAYLLSNTDQGYRYSITAQVSKTFAFGLDFMAAYTYGQSKDITNGIRNSMESNWQLNQALNPNEPGLAYSNFDIRSRYIAAVGYKLNWNNQSKFVSSFNVFFSAQSGSPYTYGFQNATIQNTAQQVSLAYIPKVGETAQFITDLKDKAGNILVTAADQVAAFDAYIDGNKYLSSRRGKFTERNGARTPWNIQADFRFTQDYNFMNGKRKNTISLTFDIVNATNLLNSDWGKQYFSPNTFNSTSSIGLTGAGAGSATTNPKYTFANPAAPYSIDYFASRYQMQFGLRYSF